MDEEPDHVLPGWVVTALRGYLERADTALKERRREDMTMELLGLAGYLAAELESNRS